jgi:hypothetical protein
MDSPTEKSTFQSIGHHFVSNFIRQMSMVIEKATNVDLEQHASPRPILRQSVIE